MSEKKHISGFSKLSKRGKIKWIVENFFKDPEGVMKELISFWHSNEEQQKILDGFSENTISNFPMPYGVAPNFIINGKTYVVPMVIEESSVVAAASAAAKFWMSRGGFQAEIIDTVKLGQLHFLWNGTPDRFSELESDLKRYLIQKAQSITENMENRGGGIRDIQIRKLEHLPELYYQLLVSFETCDSMGANFINSVLESFAENLPRFMQEQEGLTEDEQNVNVLMSILTNYTPNCLVKAWVECPIEDLGEFPSGITAFEFAERFKLAVDIAREDPYRATTHNKGIFNGVDAVAIATGNDFRAIEAAGHTYASRDGQYRSLSQCKLRDGNFHFEIELPMAVGTVGGLTSLHPMAKRSLELLDNPGAHDLMKIIACTGLAQNFAAIRSLITTGIQKGHMKMHLRNILYQLKADESEIAHAESHFQDKTVSYQSVRAFLDKQRTFAPVKD